MSAFGKVHEVVEYSVLRVVKDALRENIGRGSIEVRSVNLSVGFSPHPSVEVKLVDTSDKVFHYYAVVVEIPNVVLPDGNVSDSRFLNLSHLLTPASDSLKKALFSHEFEQEVRKRFIVAHTKLLMGV